MCTGSAGAIKTIWRLQNFYLRKPDLAGRSPQEKYTRRCSGALSGETAGQLQNLAVQSKHPVLQKAVEELFSHMKEWYPAVSHNRTVVWEDEMVIPFRTIGNYFKGPSPNSMYD